MLTKLYRLIAREKVLYAQSREIKRLRGEVETLRFQNDKINRAMRRCLTCEYRIEALAP